MPQLSSDQIGEALGLPLPPPTDYITVPPPQDSPGLANTAGASTDPSVQINEASAPLALRGGVTFPQIETLGGGPPVVVKPARDRTALDNVMGGVWQVESSDQHLDKNGRVKRNASGATGVSQLMPGTAEALGVDPTDEAQNREGGRRYLATQYDKYGNWEDALAAYNWGPGNVDKWIAKGRNPDAMPAETRAYIPAVLGSAGLTQSAGERVLSGRRQLTPDDIGEALGRPASKTMTIDGADELSPARGFAVAEEPGKATDVIDAFGHGMRRGVQDLILGPFQATLEQTSPQTAQELTRRVNAFEDQFQSTKDHPVIEFVGKVAGTTIGLLAASKLIGSGAARLDAGTSNLGLIKMAAEYVLPQFLARTGIMTRSAAGGFALGATSYNPLPEEASRVLEGVLGGSFGALGAAIGKGIVAGTRKLADTNAYNNFISSVKGALGEFSPSANKLKDLFLENYEGTIAKKNEKYAIRNAQGREIEGFDRATVGRPAQEAMTASRTAGVAPTSTTRSIATAVDRELGGPEARAAEAQHSASVKEFDKEMKDWTKIYLTGLDKVPAAQRASAIRRDIDSGVIPAPPVAPGEFDAPPITTEQFSSAMQAINRAWVGARRDPTTRFQLRQITRETLSAAEEAASAAGMDVNAFMRASTEAGKFHRENVVPMQKFVNFMSPKDVAGDPAQAFSGLSPAKFYDKIKTVLVGHDKEAIESLAKIYSSREAKDELVKVIAYDMMSALDHIGGKDRKKLPEALAKYMKDRVGNLEVLVGREGVVELTGIQKIAAQMINEPTKYGQLHRLLASHRWLQAIGAVRVGEGALTGDMHKVGVGTAMILGPWVGHHVYEIVSKIADNPQMLPLVTRAAKQKPGSAELDQTLKEIERRWVRRGQILGRINAPAANVAAPLVPQSPF